MTARKLAAAMLLATGALTLAACSAGSSSHVVQRVTPTTSVASTSTTGASGSVPVSSPVAGTPTTTPSAAALSPQTLDQVAADLGALDTNLSTANSDLNHPQGDS